MDWTRDQVGNNNKEPRLSELVEVLVVPDGDAKDVRAIGPARRVAKHWIEIQTQIKRVRVPFTCLAFDDATGKFDASPCPYCDLDPKTPGIEVHQNFIDREAQDAMPARLVRPSEAELEIREMKGYRCRIKAGKGSRTWTPCRLGVLNSGHSNPIKDFVGLNKRKIRTANGVETRVFGPEHAQYGFDVSLLYNSQRSAGQRYSAVRGENTEITKEERGYFLWDIFTDQPKTLEVARIDAKQLAPKVVREEGDGGGGATGTGGNKTGGRRQQETTIDDNEDWDTDEAPAKPARGGGRRAAAEDDFDEPTPARGRGTGGARRSAAPSEDDFGDEDFDEPAQPTRRAANGRTRAAAVDEDDFNETPRRGARPTSRRALPAEDEFDDEFDEPAPRRTTTSTRRRATEPEDDGFDDEPPRRNTRPAARDTAPTRRGAPRPRQPEPDDDDLGADDNDGWDD